MAKIEVPEPKGPNFPQDGGGHAFPVHDLIVKEDDIEILRPASPGLSIREYAAIHLKLADSGIEWLDEMIQASRNFDIQCGISVNIESIRAQMTMANQARGGPSIVKPIIMPTKPKKGH